MTRPPRPSARAATLVALGLLALAAPAGAQLDRSDTLRGSAHLYRELRAIQGRSVTQPGQAARDATTARQELLRGGQGVALDPAQQRVERSLGGLTTTPPRSLPGPARSPTVPGADLPASYEDAALLPRRSSTALAEALLDRAADGVAGGRTDQARSDLLLAQQQLQALPPDALDTPQARSLSQRAADLGRQLR